MSEKQHISRRPWSTRRKVLLASAATLVVLALALGLGLGLGLTLGRDDSPDDDDDENNGSDGTPSPLSTPPPNKTLWTPRVNSTWQIILSSPILLAKDAPSITPDVAVYDIDLFTTPKETIDTLHRLGKKVICYFSGGSYEPGRPDSDAFAEEDLGKELVGWPGERWLRLSSGNVRGIMEKRVRLAGEKGCDAVDPDNVDGYQNQNGLDLTEDDSIAFITFLSNLTAPLNLTLGLKNAGDIIPAVLPMAHFSVNEQCVDESECETFHAFIDAGKPVFHIEYPDGAGGNNGLRKTTVDRYCGNEGDAKGREGFSTVLKKMVLDGWVEYCDRDVKVTAVSQNNKDES